MTLRAALRTDFQSAPLQMTFLVVSSIVSRILVAGLVYLLDETVVSIFKLVVCQITFQFEL